MIGLTSIGNNDGDEIVADEGEIEGDKDESVTDEEGIVDDEEEIVASEGVVVDNGDVINNNISVSSLTTKGTCSNDTSFNFN